MNLHNLDRLAAELLDAYDHAQLVAQPSQRGPFTNADGYAVGARLTALRRARGERTSTGASKRASADRASTTLSRSPA